MRPKTKKMVRCFRMTIGSQQNSFQTQPVYVDKMKRCHFEVNIMDASDTIMVMISETLGERILSLTTEQISVQHLQYVNLSSSLYNYILVAFTSFVTWYDMYKGILVGYISITQSGCINKVFVFLYNNHTLTYKTYMLIACFCALM
ncbi:uncharacterized protein LOC107841405 isoform X3 [Capsicum annuum]|uniref:uncharacterized protein LOC107841405 isoform X3 n=1 Tax=Capsicum annuum TaxID=4072 RepID=UPI001FB175B1|nr:uncharacterized protein LOC107841405 isoform X3 [Capsicum annuum]